MKTVPLHGEKAAGRVALVDDEDYKLVMAHRWYLWEQRRPSGRMNGPYAIADAGRGKAMIRMHTLITGWPRTDHANHNGLDNQRHNLRPASAGQNLQNARKRRGTSSRFKGVFWDNQKHAWHATIWVSGKLVHLGFFASEEEAARTYDLNATAAFGEYACLNFCD